MEQLSRAYGRLVRAAAEAVERPSRVLLALLLAFNVGALFSVLAFATSHYALPPAASVLSTTNSSFSALRAMDLLSVLASEPHMANSRRNQEVRHWLANELTELKAYGEERGHSVELSLSDPVNIIVGPGSWQSAGTGYWQSSNLALRIKGKKSNALLVSAHYDSAPLAPGATDNGIAVAVCLETVRNILSSSPADASMQSDVIFLLNNGEEVGLLGGRSFVRHPWFSDVRAFINLDSGGAASEGARSAVWRSNSADMMRGYAASAPFPHASVASQNAMGLIPSDTDASVYSKWGLPGFDIGFYSNRNLYHSQFDDINHVSPRSVQQMGENLLANVKHFCAADVANIRVQSGTTGFEQTDFAYAELRGMGMFILSARLYRTALVILTVIIMGLFTSLFRSVGVAWRNALPFLDACVVVMLSIGLPPLLVLTLSWLKAAVNPGSSYGHPVLNFVWVAAAVLLAILIVLHAVAPRIQLASHSTLPYASVGDVEIGEEEDDDEDSASVEAAFASGSGTTNPQQVLYGNTWITWAMLAFNGACLLVALKMSAAGAQSGFVLLELGFWSTYAVAFNAAVAFAITRPSIISVFPDINLQNFFQRWAWFFYLSNSSWFPLLRLADFIDMAVLNILPSTVSEGLPEPVMDLFSATLVTLSLSTAIPALRHMPVRIGRVCIAVMSGIFLVAYITAMVRFPFSSNAPAHVVYYERWDVTTAESASLSGFSLRTDGLFTIDDMAKLAQRRGVHGLDCRTVPKRCVKMDAPPPEIRDAVSSTVLGWDSVLTVKLDPLQAVADGSNNTSVLRGEFTGPPGSKTCSVRILTHDGRLDPYLELTLDSRDGSQWVNEGDNSEEGTPPSAVTHYIERTLRARRFSDPVAQTLTTGFAASFTRGEPRPEVVVNCMLDETVVSQARRLVDGTVVGGWLGWYPWGRGDGGLTVEKVV
ncbi:hypothetical protein HDU88_005708 [Geranomyces variabilis]|nr:hypothetical protein HDU88_005708 [Geranomyces variabilis]